MSTFNRFTETQVRSFIKGFTKLVCSVTFGGSGAAGTKGAGTLAGNGIASVTKLGTGIYRIVFDNKISRVLNVAATVIPTVSGGDVNANALSGGTLYRIKTVGSTVWTDNGAREARVGEAFVASGASTGTGVAEAVVINQISSCFLAGNTTNTDHVVVVLVDDAGAVIEPTSGDVIILSVEARVSGVDNNGV